MNRPEGIEHHASSVVGDHGGPTSITSLVADLASQDGRARATARGALAAIGPPAIAPLTDALADSRVQVRWEAVKALGEILDPAAAPALVEALRDAQSGVRWLAAEGLIALGPNGLEPLLQALVKHSDSTLLRQSAHHVLHDLARGNVEKVARPVLTALEDVEPSLEVPWAAETALDALAKVSLAGRGTR